MAKKGAAELRIQRSVLRRVVTDKLQALLRGDFYVRNHLGEENYGPIVDETKRFDADFLMALMQHERDVATAAPSSAAATAASTASAVSTQQLQFSKELETFIQILAASIMIDASMRGENAGESDTRFIKKKKKLLTRMLMGGKLYTLRREIIRFDLIHQRGVKDGSVELIKAIGMDPPETEVEEGSSSSESEDEERRKDNKRKFKHAADAAAATTTGKNDIDDNKSAGSIDKDSSEDEEEDDESLSDTATSENTSLSKSGAEDGFSASASSSKLNMKKAKKKARKEEKRRLKKERRRLRRERKERKRMEKEERKRKRKLEKEQKKRKKMKLHHHHLEKQHHDSNDEFMEEEEEEQFDNDMDEDAVDEEAEELDSNQIDDDDDTPEEEEEASSSPFDFKSKEDFEAYRDDIISQIPKSIRKRFRQGGFSKWGKDWLPVIELGPFDVEPGPVREMWMDMFHNVSFFCSFD